MFEKILIANRGEIACRIIRTAKRLGIKTVAVYSEADTNALHVKQADEAIYIGPSPSTQSYLNSENILDAIRQSGAQAVHPGYGFLSENADFAEAIQKEGIVFIGPSPRAIHNMGDKIEAKKIAEKAGVDTVPGHMGAIDNVKDATKIAAKIGFPVMIKAAAGGGGKGMRVAHSKQDVKQAFSSASNEAKSSFSDDRVFIEKYIEQPRHIEIQVLADKHGNVVCLGERECSIQRHHQKVIEEAPSPFIDDKTRAKMYKQVVSLVKKVKYYSVGTVEFIVDQDKTFYFMEMNTRLQVEHCVTELITGIDLVEQMIRVAEGEKLTIAQKDVALNGWAIEVRVYAEDPSRGFLPSCGRIIQYREPKNRTNIRIDSGVYEGGEVSMFYDAMIAKVCSYGSDRLEAIDHMKRALGDFVINGISNNISFLEAVMEHPRFVSGDISTRFIEDEYSNGFSGAELTDEKTRVVLAVALHIYLDDVHRSTTITGQLPGQGRHIGTRWVVTIDKANYPVTVSPRKGGYNIRHDQNRMTVRSAWTLGSRLFKGKVDDRPVSVKIDYYPGGVYLTNAGSSVKVVVRSPRIAELAQFMPEPQENMSIMHLESPMSGMLISLKVKEGEKVKEGKELAIVEAMKMENIVYAKQNVQVDRILVKEKEAVHAGQVIMTFKKNSNNDEKQV